MPPPTTAIKSPAASTNVDRSITAVKEFAMSQTLPQLGSRTISSYIATLGSFLSTLEALINTMTTLMHSDEHCFGPVERALVEYILASANNATQSIQLFRQANLLLGELNDDQRATLGEFMDTLGKLEGDLVQPVEEMHIIRDGW